MNRLDPGEELIDGERLDEVVVGPGAEAGELVGDGAQGREENHRRPHAGIAGRSQHLEAAHLREQDVEDDDVIGEERVLVNRGLAVGNPRAFMAGLPNCRGHGLGDDGVVLDDGDVHEWSSLTPDFPGTVS